MKLFKRRQAEFKFVEGKIVQSNRFAKINNKRAIKITGFNENNKNHFRELMRVTSRKGKSCRSLFLELNDQPFIYLSTSLLHLSCYDLGFFMRNEISSITVLTVNKYEKQEDGEFVDVDESKLLEFVEYQEEGLMTIEEAKQRFSYETMLGFYLNPSDKDLERTKENSEAFKKVFELIE